MNDSQKQIISNLVHTFVNKANISNQDEIGGAIARLCSLNVDDAIDSILVLLNSLFGRKMITYDEILENVQPILQLNPEKYSSVDDLQNRLKWILAMNLEHPNMPLTENHRLVMEAFDSFNSLLAGSFDCYYTGGMMGYLATNRELERYHGDLDLFINEQQLLRLKELIDVSDDFEFVSNMSHKEVSGHEYKIAYKGTEMSIGLFLFERNPDNSITTKEYYFEHCDTNGPLFVDEHHYTKVYTEMSFSDSTNYHNGIPYKMMSLESIYNSKKNSRPKDRYDAQIIKDSIDMMIDYKLDVERPNNYHVHHKLLPDSIIHNIEQSIHHNKCRDESSVKK